MLSYSSERAARRRASARADLGLGRRPLGELAGAQRRSLGPGQLAQVVERAAGDPERDGGDRGREQPERRERVEGPALARPVGDQRGRARRRDREPVDGDVVAAGRPQPGDRPGVDHLDLGRRHQHQADVRAGRSASSRGASPSMHDAPAHQPVAVVDVAAEAPAAADDELVARADGAPHRREDAADDAGRVAVDLARRLRLEVRGEHARGRADGDAPAGRRVAPGERLDRAEQLGRRRLAAAERGRHAEPVEPGRRELVRELRRQPPLRLRGRCDLGRARGESPGGVERRGHGFTHLRAP